jgi:hypothetical protein
MTEPSLALYLKTGILVRLERRSRHAGRPAVYEFGLGRLEPSATVVSVSEIGPFRLLATAVIRAGCCQNCCQGEALPSLGGTRCSVPLSSRNFFKATGTRGDAHSARTVLVRFPSLCQSPRIP